jgi:UDP-glucose 4-epimerase
MRNLLIGGAGFIGRNLLEILESDPEQESMVVDCFRNSEPGGFVTEFPQVKLHVLDATDQIMLKEIISKFKPHRIYHLAANSDIKLSSTDPKIDMEDTFLTTLSIVNAIEGFKPELFFASSSAIYGEKSGSIREDDSKVPVSPYGWMKWSSEEILLQAIKQEKIGKLVIFRFPNVVGKYMTHGVIFDLLQKLHNESKNLKVLGNGNQKKPYVLADELCALILRAMTKESRTQILNISNGTQVLVNEIVHAICSITKLFPVVEYSTTKGGWLGDIPEYQLDCSRAEKYLGELDLTNSHAAIEEAIKLHINKFPFP